MPAMNSRERFFESDRDFTLGADDVPVMVRKIDQAGRSAGSNAAWRRFTGSALDGAFHDGLLDCMPADDRATYLQALTTALRVREAVRLEYRLRRYDGVYRCMEETYTPFYNDDAFCGFVCVCNDVSEHKAALAERESRYDALLVREREARLQAETTARVREQFLSIVSHELRSPLNGIQSWAHVLENLMGIESPAVQRALTGIKTGVEHQVRLIDDLLDSTGIASGKLALHREVFVLREVIEATVDELRSAAAERELTVITDVRLGDERMDGDRARVRQVVWQLLSNAIKFNQSGGSVWISAWVLDAVEGAGPGRENRLACITVRDSGRGFDAAMADEIFEPFNQSDRAFTRNTGGIGLGLSVAKRLAEMHGGSVSARSTGCGQGAEFALILPLTEPSAEMRRTVVQANLFERLPSLAGRSVMVIDDQQEARESLTALLTQSGAQVQACASGQEALDRLEDLGVAARPQVLVCDIAMPGQDGYRTLQRIRSWERAHNIMAAARMPAIALTAFAQTEDRMRALAHGFEVHLAKPVVPAELLVALVRLADVRADRALPPVEAEVAVLATEQAERRI